MIFFSIFFNTPIVANFLKMKKYWMEIDATLIANFSIFTSGILMIDHDLHILYARIFEFDLS